MKRKEWTNARRAALREELDLWVDYSLFFNGRERATRLMLVIDQGERKLPRDLGGLCRSAVVDRIEEYIVSRFDPRVEIKKKRGGK